MGRLRHQRPPDVAARGECVRAHVTAAASVNSDIMEGTVMARARVGKNFELRPEFRVDSRRPEPQFPNAGNDANQVTGTLAALDVLLRRHVDTADRHARVAARSTRAFFFAARRDRAAHVRRSRSLSTPAAVTAGPAPGPVMTSGFLR